MAKRNPRGRAPSKAGQAAAAAAVADDPAPSADDDPDAAFAAWLGERLRRVALGALAALVVARAYWPGEPDFREDAGAGLTWVFALLVVAGVAAASWLVGGRLRVRASWADAAFLVLVALVAAAAGHAVDRRPAINLAWEWVAVGVAYALARALPRTRGESSALVGALAATAVAVSVYGLFQVGVELPEVQRKYLANREEALRLVGIEPGSPQQALYENRLLGSNEPFATFALANSLAGFLVGPLVVMLAVGWDRLTRRTPGEGASGGRLAALLPAVPAVAAVLVCLTLTKSRSAYVGLACGLLVLAWRERTRVRPRTLALAAAGAFLVAAGLAAAGLATGRLDREVLTQAGKSFQYRREYWAGAWRAVNESPRAFWTGFGPGNFSAPYVRHKLPQASEDVHDPHNFVLEVWSDAGLWAVLALAAAVLLILGNLLGSGQGGGNLPGEGRDPDLDGRDGAAKPGVPGAKGSRGDPSAPPAGAGWLVLCAGLGWVAALPPLGALNPFEGDLFTRWLVLGVAWATAVGAGAWLWRRREPDPAAVGAGVLAVLVNLLAAGGLSVPAVALGLWVAAAAGQNLRADRACGRPRDAGGRVAAFGVAAVWAALLGSFYGAVSPHWRLERELAVASDFLAARPPDFDRAEAALNRAAEADKYSARPWLALASLDYQAWTSRGAKPDDLRWRKIPIELFKAVSPPRTPDSWVRHRERARWTTLLLRQLGGSIPPLEITRYRANVVEATRKAVRLYPTNASLRARLAEASAEVGYVPDALKEGREALRLDALTPHADRKLEPGVRLWLLAQISVWAKSVDDATPAPADPKAGGPEATPPSSRP